VTADIRYLEAGTDTLYVDESALPWQMYLEAESGDPVHLRAISRSPNSVTLNVAVFVEGAVLEYAEETGINVVVAINDTIP
jgi:hypothetical protein